jgi:hypothetical protein
LGAVLDCVGFDDFCVSVITIVGLL